MDGGIYYGGSYYGSSDNTVRIENCIVNGNDSFGVKYGYGQFVRPVILVACTIEGNAGPGVYGKHTVILGCNISGNTGDGINSPSYFPTAKLGENQAVSDVISNCIIENNGGSGIMVQGYSRLIENCLIKNNQGRGISLATDTYGTITGCAIIGNHGGGIRGISGTSLTNCLIAYNSTSGDGGGIWGSNFNLTNCTFIGNSATAGAAIYYYRQATGSITNCIIAFNLGEELIHCYSAEWTPSIAYSDVFGNSGGDWVGCIADQADTNGNFSADPQFCDTVNSDYYLWNTSPCLTAGQGGGYIGAFGQGCGFVLASGPALFGTAGTQVPAAFLIQNIGHCINTLDLDISDQLGWNINPLHYDLVQDSGRIDTVAFTVSVPYVPLGTTNQLKLLAVSKTNPLARDSASLTVTCNAYAESWDIASESNLNGPSNSHVTAVFYVQNNGLAVDSCSLGVSDSLGWNIQPHSCKRVLNPNQRDSVLFDILIPNVSIGTTDKVSLRGVSSTNPFVGDSASLFVICSSYNITITGISDFPNDAGKQVQIHWSSFPGFDPLVTNFTVFRRIDSLFSGLDSKDSKILSLVYPPGNWQILETYPAYGETLYSAIVSTLEDSTIAEGMSWSVFFIRAGTSNPILYFDSPVDSGYSLDNLPPTPPTGLSSYHKQSATKLTWSPTLSPDLYYYTLYCDTLSGFAPDSSHRLGFAIETIFVDSSAQLGKTFYYLVSATDFSGNESNPSNEAMGVRYITGDANTDAIIDIGDIVYLIN
jgi:hypothetical protein